MVAKSISLSSFDSFTLYFVLLHRHGFLWPAVFRTENGFTSIFLSLSIGTSHSHRVSQNYICCNIRTNIALFTLKLKSSSSCTRIHANTQMNTPIDNICICVYIPNIYLGIYSSSNIYFLQSGVSLAALCTKCNTPSGPPSFVEPGNTCINWMCIPYARQIYSHYIICYEKCIQTAQLFKCKSCFYAWMS